MATEVLRKLAPSFTHQISPDVGHPVIFRARPTGEFFNPTAIPIACVEIHLGINAGGIESKQPLHAAETLEDPSAIQQAKLSHAGERVDDQEMLLCLAA